MTVNISTLQLGGKLGEGGQAEVFLVSNRTGFAFKRYRPEALQAFRPDVLEELAAETAHLTLEGLPITHWATWPTETVTDGSRVIGFLMPQLADQFIFPEGSLHKKPATFAYLACEPPPFWAEVRLPDLSGRVQLLAQLAGLLQQLHHRRMVVGDLSWGNVLWAQTPDLRVILLDCDGIRPPGGVSVTRQLDSPDWGDPLAPPDGAPDADRDCYKLALMVLRVLSKNLTARPLPSGEHALPGLAVETTAAINALLVRAGGPYGSRPSAKEWRYALQNRSIRSVEIPVPRPRETPAPPKPARQWNAVTQPRPRGGTVPASTPANASSPDNTRRWKPLPPTDKQP